jgi:hypothetical protein
MLFFLDYLPVETNLVITELANPIIFDYFREFA